MLEASALEVRPLGRSEPVVDLLDVFCPRGETWTIVHAGDGLRLVRTHGESTGARWAWTVSRYALADGRVTSALDRTRFEADDESFGEVSLEHARSGSNMHAEPIRLPRRIKLGAWHHPFSSGTGRVGLVHAGEVELVLGDQRRRLRAACLHAEERGVERVQWLAEGIGEVALGPSGGPFDRWMTAHRGADGCSVIADVDATLRERALPELPGGAAAPARRSLY